jgi:hypothetical protein
VAGCDNVGAVGIVAGRECGKWVKRRGAGRRRMVRRSEEPKPADRALCSNGQDGVEGLGVMTTTHGGKLCLLTCGSSTEGLQHLDRPSLPSSILLVSTVGFFVLALHALL